MIGRWLLKRRIRRTVLRRLQALRAQLAQWPAITVIDLDPATIRGSDEQD